MQSINRFAPTAAFMTLLLGTALGCLALGVWGVRSFARGKKPDGSEMAAINVRCLEGVDLDSLKIKKVNGRDF